MNVQFHIRSVNITAKARNWLRESLEQLQRLLPISGATVVLEHRWDGAPAFRAFVSLAVPGPDIHAEARDHTLAVAWLRARAALRRQIQQRKAKQLPPIRSAPQRPMFMISLKTIKRLVVVTVGGTVLLLGIALLVLPGPAFIVIPLGLAILAAEFTWARRWLRKARDLIPNDNSGQGVSASVVRHSRNFLEWASRRPNKQQSIQRKGKNMKHGKLDIQSSAEGHSNQEKIALRAYEFYQARGGEAGHELEDWLNAEQELNKEIQILPREP